MKIRVLELRLVAHPDKADELPDVNEIPLFRHGTGFGNPKEYSPEKLGEAAITLADGWHEIAHRNVEFWKSVLEKSEKK